MSGRLIRLLPEQDFRCSIPFFSLPALTNAVARLKRARQPWGSSLNASSKAGTAQSSRFSPGIKNAEGIVPFRGGMTGDRSQEVADAGIRLAEILTNVGEEARFRR